MKYSSLRIDLNVFSFFFVLYRSALDPRMNSNKFETGTLRNVTGSCIYSKKD